MSSYNIEEERAKRRRPATGERPVRSDSGDRPVRTSASDRPVRSSAGERPVRRTSDSDRRQTSLDGENRTRTTRTQSGESRRPEGTRRPEGAKRPDGTTRRPEGARRSEGTTRRPEGAKRPDGTTRRPEGVRRPDGATRRPEGATRRPDANSRTEGTRRPVTRKPAKKSFLDNVKDKFSKDSNRELTRAEFVAKKKKEAQIKQYAIYAGIAIAAILVIILVAKVISSAVSGKDGIVKNAGNITVEKKLLTVDKKTRSGQKLEKVNKIVVHTTGDSTASANKMWDYYESLTKSGDISESVHFLIDTDGKIVQLIPTNEVAFHALSVNHESIGIQYCSSADNGVMSDKTKESLVELLTTLCKENKVSSADIVLHSSVTGIACPKYYSDNSAEWQSIIDEVSKKLK